MCNRVARRSGGTGDGIGVHKGSDGDDYNGRAGKGAAPTHRCRLGGGPAELRLAFSQDRPAKAAVDRSSTGSDPPLRSPLSSHIESIDSHGA